MTGIVRHGGHAPPIIASFTGRAQFLSNFWYCDVAFEKMLFPSVEHAYQAAKTLDLEMRKRFTLNSPPGAAKAAGRALALRADWADVKLDVMRACVRSKFERNTQLGASLLATWPADLQEGNTWGDRFWGVVRGEGLNHLGNILMDVRQAIRNQSFYTGE